MKKQGTLSVVQIMLCIQHLWLDAITGSGCHAEIHASMYLCVIYSYCVLYLYFCYWYWKDMLKIPGCEIRLSLSPPVFFSMLAKGVKKLLELNLRFQRRQLGKKTRKKFQRKKTITWGQTCGKRSPRIALAALWSDLDRTSGERTGPCSGRCIWKRYTFRLSSSLLSTNCFQ